MLKVKLLHSTILTPAHHYILLHYTALHCPSLHYTALQVLLLLSLLPAGQPARVEGSALRAFLGRLSVDYYFDSFIKEDITIHLLPHLTDHQLERLGIASMGHRMKIMIAAQQLTAADMEEVEVEAGSANHQDPAHQAAAQAGYILILISNLNLNLNSILFSFIF